MISTRAGASPARTLDEPLLMRETRAGASPARTLHEPLLMEDRMELN